MLNKRHPLNQANNKDKEKGFERQNKTENQTTERIYEINFIIECVDVALFLMNRSKETKRQKQGSKRKQNRKKTRTNRTRERQRKRE